MDLPSGRKFLRFGKLKSNFFKEFSQNQCIIAHTLQDPVRTNCRFENVENETTQHKLYTHWRNYTYNSQCLYPQLQSGIIFNRIFSVYTNTCSVSGTSKTKFFVADINIKCNGVHCMRAAGENFWKYVVYAYLHRHTRITWNRTSYEYVCWKHHVYTGNMFCVRKATIHV